jgi:hypothetical protein
MPDENEQPKERKSLDERAKMTELERIGHWCACVMATAILRIWPKAQFAVGPPVENRFYYDVELPRRDVLQTKRANTRRERGGCLRASAMAGDLADGSAGAVGIRAWPAYGLAVR